MKKRSLLILLSIFALTACGKNKESASSTPIKQEDTKIDLASVSALLTTDLYYNEVEQASKVEFENINQRGENRVNSTKETYYIYNDQISYAEGEEKTEYAALGTQPASVTSDTYQTVAAAKMLGNQKVFYLVKDFKDGTVRTTWADSAYRLPIVATGSTSGDGVSYLLESSVPGQLSKQVSLLANSFLSANILNNPDVQMIMPKAHITKEKNMTTYWIKNFEYSYKEDDGSLVTVSSSFEFKVSLNRLVSVNTEYKTTQSRNDENYVEVDTNTYQISYDERVASSTNDKIIEPTDYFLNEVTSVKAYIYNDRGNKEYVSLNNLPIGKYIHVEAENYAPAKAVDLEMYPVSSSNSAVIASSKTVFETLTTGMATLKVESATGIEFSLDVRVNIQPVARIVYVDTTSDIEIAYTNGGESIERAIYTNTVYDRGIYVQVSPSSASIEDVVISVSDESALKVTSSVSEGKKLINLTLEVLDTTATEVSLTLKSYANENVTTTITYQIKQRLSVAEMKAKLMSNTYRWDSIYDIGWYALLTFTSETQAKVAYYKDGNLEAEFTMTYSFNGMTLTPKMTQQEPWYNYNGGSLALDGNRVTLSVNVTDYIHTFHIVEA